MSIISLDSQCKSSYNIANCLIYRHISSIKSGDVGIVALIDSISSMLTNTNHIFEVPTCIFGTPTTRYCAMPAMPVVPAGSASAPMVDPIDSAAFRFLAMAKKKTVGTWPFYRSYRSCIEDHIVGFIPFVEKIWGDLRRSCIDLMANWTMIGNENEILPVLSFLWKKVLNSDEPSCMMLYDAV